MASKKKTAPVKEPEATTNPVQEAPAVQEAQEPAQVPEAPQEPPGERLLPYKAVVAVSLATLHKAVGIGTADMLKVVGTLRQGMVVTVTGRSGPYAQLKNGLWMKETFLEVQTIS